MRVPWPTRGAQRDIVRPWLIAALSGGCLFFLANLAEDTSLCSVDEWFRCAEHKHRCTLIYRTALVRCLSDENRPSGGICCATIYRLWGRAAIIRSFWRLADLRACRGPPSRRPLVTGISPSTRFGDTFGRNTMTILLGRPFWGNELTGKSLAISGRLSRSLTDIFGCGIRCASTRLPSGLGTHHRWCTRTLHPQGTRAAFKRSSLS